MRKVLPAIVMGVGAFLLVLGLLLKFYAYPQLAVVPLDQNTQQIVQDENASFFDATTVSPSSGTLTTVATVIGDPEASEQASEELGQKVAVWNLGQKSDNNDDDQPMTASQEKVVFDRHTGEAVNCCGESIDGQEVRHEGLVVKFPFDTQQSDDYRWWDSTTRAAYPVSFEGEEDLAGVRVYKFTSEVPKTQYMTQELPGNLFGGAPNSGAVNAERFYENKRTFWVEPVTGVVLDRTEEQKQEFAYDGQILPALDTVSRFTQETVDKNIDQYGPLSTQLKAVQSTASIPMIILGALLLLAGLLWSLLAGRARSGSDEPGYAAHPREAGDPVFASNPPSATNPPPPAPNPAAGRPGPGTAGSDEATRRRGDLHR